MSSLIDFFNNQDTEKGLSHKNNLIKRNVIAYMAANGEVTLAELTKELKISVPTITKLVQELADEGIVSDLGKVETQGGRRPNVFGLTCSTLYFAGVHVGRDSMTCVITDLQNNLVYELIYDD
ncbi:MAG: MarR family transcriptional regulator, partial [Alistipes sp.]|nr:MarR family transcriptional regulator [Alistipes sp.]